jgi:DNA processing protein
MNQPLPWLRLQLTPGLGRIGMMRLIEHFRTPENALQAIEQGWPKHLRLHDGLAKMVPQPGDSKVHKASAALEKMGGWICTFWEPAYPQSLRQIADPPALLYVCGKLPQGRALAIVGTRHPTHCGRRFTEKLAQELAEKGVTIISGLARGIDTAAHRGALNAGGKTVAVLGCGIDKVYPRENAEIYHQITDKGALVSEYPPGSEPLACHFPGRNRIISALSVGTLVVEAARDSGSLITAEFALDQGREVMAVPGGIDRKTSYGTNLLLKQGAHPVTEATEILQILGINSAVEKQKQTNLSPPVQLPEPFVSVLSGLDLTPRHSDELAGESGLTPMELSAILLQLELQGYAEKLPGGRYIRGRRTH